MANNYLPTIKQTAISTLLAAVCCLAVGSHAATLYKWTDDNGVIHFTEHPPAGVTNVEKVRNHVGRGNSPVQYNGSRQDSSADQSTNSQQNSNNQPQRDPAVQKARCETARKNLDALSSFVRIREKDENGELRFLSEEEVQERRQNFKSIIEKECQGS